MRFFALVRTCNGGMFCEYVVYSPSQGRCPSEQPGCDFLPLLLFAAAAGFVDFAMLALARALTRHVFVEVDQLRCL